MGKLFLGLGLVLSLAACSSGGEVQIPDLIPPADGSGSGVLSLQKADVPANVPELESDQVYYGKLAGQYGEVLTFSLPAAQTTGVVDIEFDKSDRDQLQVEEAALAWIGQCPDITFESWIFFIDDQGMVSQLQAIDPLASIDNQPGLRPLVRLYYANRGSCTVTHSFALGQVE